MADNAKYYYFRLMDNFFDSDTMIILESMPDGYLYSNILLKLYAKSLKGGGRLMFNESIPYNPTILAQITRHQIGTVEKALKLFTELGIIEVLANGAIYMIDIQNYIGKSSTEADRKRLYRVRIESEKTSGFLLDKSPDISLDKSTPEIEIEIEIEKEIKLKLDNTAKAVERTTAEDVISLYNSICLSLPKVKMITDNRIKTINAILKKYSYNNFENIFTIAEESDFLKGKIIKNFKASFDWLLKEHNIVKVLEGNYENNKKDTQPFEYDAGNTEGSL